MEAVRSHDIVFSQAGHDKGKAFIVLKTDGERLWLVDGKTRKLKSPKMKSLKHIRFGRTANPVLAEALGSETATDRLIKKELAIFRGEVGMTEEGNQFVKR